MKCTGRSCACARNKVGQGCSITAHLKKSHTPKKRPPPNTKLPLPNSEPKLVFCLKYPILTSRKRGSPVSHLPFGPKKCGSGFWICGRTTTISALPSYSLHHPHYKTIIMMINTISDSMNLTPKAMLHPPPTLHRLNNDVTKGEGGGG